VPIRVKVLYFGQAREAAGTRAEEFSLPQASSVKALVSMSVEAHRRLQEISRAMRIAVNEEIAGDDERLAEGDVVAFLPPGAGG
jgi:molybdopterin converting factor subunit 1